MDFFWFKIMELWRWLNDPAAFHSFVNNRFILVLLVVVLVRARYATYRSLWLSALVNVPGTFLHESAHWIVGFVLNGHPTSFSLFPRKNPDGSYTLGTVGLRNVTRYNALPTALAPLLLLPLGFWMNTHMPELLAPTFFNYVLFVLLLALVIENSLPSRGDVKVAFKFPLGVAGYGALGAGLLYAWAAGYF